MKTTTRDDIAEYIHEKFGLSKIDCNNIVNSIIEELINGLIKNNKIKIHNFGSFHLKYKKQRPGRNPKTKETVIIQPRNVISFTLSKKILNELNVLLDE